MKNFTFAHALAIIAGAFPVLQQLLPSLVPPPYGIALGAIVGILGGLTHAATSTPASSSLPPPSAGTVVKLHLLTVLVVATMVFLSGCATLSKVATDITAPASQPYVTAAANGAVLLAESQGITAAQINGVATKALAADSGTSATLATVSTVLNTQLAKLGLNSIESIVASALVSGLTNAINQQLQANTSVAQVQAAIADILNAVIAATAPLTGSTFLQGFSVGQAWAVANIPESALPKHCVMLTSYPDRLVCTD